MNKNPSFPKSVEFLPIFIVLDTKAILASLKKQRTGDGGPGGLMSQSFRQSGVSTGQTLTSQVTSIVVSSALVGKTKLSNEKLTADWLVCESLNEKFTSSTGQLSRISRLALIVVSSSVHLPTENSSDDGSADVGVTWPYIAAPGVNDLVEKSTEVVNASLS